ncbi:MULTISPECIES: hypothetical protein [unclassified Microcoleus]|uniref:hypothetical protein n=1 Tax=unclassified Microcoleus TaxID=2642155 RepID=UPI002FCFFFDE
MGKGEFGSGELVIAYLKGIFGRASRPTPTSHKNFIPLDFQLTVDRLTVDRTRGDFYLEVRGLE